MRTVLVAEPRSGASYVLDVLRAAYNEATLITSPGGTLDYYKWLLEDSRVIWLTRDNKHDQRNSWIIAHQTNKWHWTSEHKNRLIELIPRVEYSKEADDEFHSRILLINSLHRFKLPHHTATAYEQLLLDNELHPYKVKEQLGITTTLMPKYIATPYNHPRCDYIINNGLKDSI